MEINAINLAEKLALFTEQWKPKIVARMNDYHFKIAKVEGEFIWHAHPATDEAFIVLEGELTMHFRERTVVLKKGELLVVPAGVEHRPCAERECAIMMVEAAGTLNTGDAGGERTAANDVWI